MRVFLRSAFASLCLLPASLGSALLLSGCANSFEPGQVAATDTTTLTMSGGAFGGFFPVVGAHIFLFSPGTSGVGGASKSLISSSSSGYTIDTGSGSITYGDGYVTTTTGGNFSFTSTCTVGQPVYIYASGGVGTTGAANNPQIGLMAVVGICPSTGTVDNFSYIHISELSTVAAAYALAGFAVDPGHISYTGTSLGLVGITNAFNTALSLQNPYAVFSYSISSAFGTATLASGSTGVLPQTTLNSLADILASCVNSANSASASTTACNGLRAYATNTGTAGTLVTAPAVSGYSSTEPADTATAMINIANFPFSNASSLWNYQGTTVYKPALSAAPATYAVEILYSGGGSTSHDLTGLHGIAVDGSGNVWFNNSDMHTVSKFSPLGVPLSGSSGYASTASTNCYLSNSTSTGYGSNTALAIDVSGNAWIGFSIDGDSVCELNSSGSLSGAVLINSPYDTNYTGVEDIAFDASGNAWVAASSSAAGSTDAGDKLVKLSGGSSPAIVSTYTGNDVYGGGPYAVAVDAPSTYSGHTGDIWVAEYNYAGDSVFTASGGTAFIATGGSSNYPLQYSNAVAFDANGYAWNASYDVNNSAGTGSYLTKTASTGSSGTSYVFASTDNIQSLTLDGAGSVWICNEDANSQFNIAEVSNTGTLLTPTSGYVPINGKTTNSSPVYANTLAVDGSGNVWFLMYGDPTLHQLLGAATPVATPTAYGVVNNKLGARP